MQDGYNISCGITIETAFIQKNRVENTVLAKLLQNTELALIRCTYDKNLKMIQPLVQELQHFLCLRF
jgi:hypothetical protein